jgi:hypothetical protein
MGDMTKHFSRWELACNCGHCSDMCEMQQPLLDMLENARVESDTSYTVTSGYRCPQHEESIRRPTSSHPKGLAVDIYAPNSRKRFLILSGLLAVGCKRIGIGKEFIHADCDSDKEVGVVWGYYG